VIIQPKEIDGCCFAKIVLLMEMSSRNIIGQNIELDISASSMIATQTMKSTAIFINLLFLWCTFLRNNLNSAEQLPSTSARKLHI
jgi:hypothetical protein